MRNVFLEGIGVLLAGALAALAANALSPRGLTLTRDYFPMAFPSTAAVQNSIAGSAAHDSANHLPVPSPLAARATEMGLHLAGSNEVIQLFHRAQQESNAVAFVDARNTESFESGHVPGAYQLDYYHKENYLPQVLPACLAAQAVVVYCNGGNCEDSLLTASVLLAPVIPKEKLLVYAGGYTEWTNNRLPVELGAQNSGRLSPAK